MNLSRKWLLDFADITGIDDKKFADEMTLSGSKVEAFEKEGAELKNIVVGKIEEIEHHPDSDHLWICKVNIGEAECIQIVTGAQNLKAGDYVPAALDNSVVYGGKVIKKGKLRGAESCGMLCSLGELGLTLHDFPYAVEDGIFVLGDDCEKRTGMDIHDAIGLNDTVTEFEITSNRPDCLSILGLAREAAATFGVPFTPHTPVVQQGSGDVNELLKVNILCPEKCYRYCGAVVQNVRVKPSPRYIRERLRACGVRPINNIVDITNYVMLEYGQPMHAFDLRFVDGAAITVREAQDGEKITTLDGIERSLSAGMTVIADESKPIAVAGVMGGEYSGIMDDTTTIVFESACFNGPSTRITAKKLGLRTEASGRYEKELDPESCMPALCRALELIRQLDAGDIVNGIIDCDKSMHEIRTLPFEPEWVNAFIGIDVAPDEQKRILEAIDFKVENGLIYIPSYRNDIEHKADISEEVARFNGFHNIPNRALGGVACAMLTPRQKLEKTVNATMLACGFTEISTYSFISPKAYDKIRLPADSSKRDCVVISNPLGEDTSVMRTTAIPSMLEVLSRNYNNRNESAALYELATDYTSRGTEELPIEGVKVILGLYGEKADFYALKGAVETLLEKAGVYGADIEPVSDDPTFHPGRTAALTVDGKPLAILGEVHPKVLENYEIDVKAYVASIDFELMVQQSDLQKAYKPLPKFPATTRDLAFVCDKDVPVITVQNEIVKAAGKLLEKIELFDIYEGSQIPDGCKSAAFSLTLRSADRTLTDEEADGAVKRAVKALAKLGITLRA